MAWDSVTRDQVSRAIAEYDRLGPEQFFSHHGFGPCCSAEGWSEGEAGVLSNVEGLKLPSSRSATRISIDILIPPGAALIRRKETRLCAQSLVVSPCCRSCSS